MQKFAGLKSSLPKARAARFMASTSIAQSKDVELKFGDDGFAELSLNRPEVHNAFNDTVVAHLHDAVREVERKGTSVRGLFVTSKGKSFSAGGDLNYMKAMAEAPKERNIADAAALSKFLNALSNVGVPTIALVQGPAYGGGVGLISVCDIAIGVQSATFALSEVKLGLLPATISPYVIQRIGAAQARRYFLTAERFDAPTAQRIGLLHEVVESAQQLEEWRARFKAILRQNSPTAIAASKALITAVAGRTINEAVILDTANRLADQRGSPEGAEGVGAFLEKRPAKWTL